MLTFLLSYLNTSLHILAVDDDEDILEVIRYHLTREGWRVTLLADGGSVVPTSSGTDRPDLILLDLMLPGLSGLEVARRLKGSPDLAKIPIMMITARGEESDIVAGLELGADDYIVKPFSPRVLVARIKAVLRRRQQSPVGDTGEQLQYDNLQILTAQYRALVDGEDVALTTTEFKLLGFLARRPGWVFTRNQIVDAVRGEDHFVTDRSVDVHIVSLRRKLGQYGRLVETVRGVGYRWKG